MDSSSRSTAGSDRRRARQPILQPLERLQEPGLAALQEQERIDERTEPARLDQRFARQAHQPREALRRHSHDAVGRLRGTGRWPGRGDACGGRGGSGLARSAAVGGAGEGWARSGDARAAAQRASAARRAGAERGGAACHRRCFTRLDGGEVGHQRLDLLAMRRLPRLQLRLRNLRDLHQQVHPARAARRCAPARSRPAPSAPRPGSPPSRGPPAPPRPGPRPAPRPSASAPRASRARSSPAVAPAPSSATRPCDSTASRSSASMRNRSIIEKPLRSSLIARCSATRQRPAARRGS